MYTVTSFVYVLVPFDRSHLLVGTSVVWYIYYIILFWRGGESLYHSSCSVPYLFLFICRPLKSGEKSGGNRQGSELLQTTQDVKTNTESTQVESKGEDWMNMFLCFYLVAIKVGGIT